jgi:hypothetical protein
MTVASDADAIFAMLLPIKIVVNTFSKSFDSLRVVFARLLPFSAKCLILISFNAENAISVAEKNADNKIKIAKTIICI